MNNINLQEQIEAVNDAIADDGGNYIDHSILSSLKRLQAIEGQEAVAWQFYQDEKWFNGTDHHDHYKNTKEAGYPVRELYAIPPDAQGIIDALRNQMEQGDEKPVSNDEYKAIIEVGYKLGYEAAICDIAKSATPEGMVLVPSKEFNELIHWLDRCDDKGHLDNCPDLIEPLADFNKAIQSAQQGDNHAEQ